MKLTDRLKTEICYFHFKIDTSIFHMAGLDGVLTYGYCRVLNHTYLQGLFEGYYLIGVYNFFSDSPISDINLIKNTDWLFNQRLCVQPPLRGKDKVTFLGSESYSKIELPHLTSLNRKVPQIKEYGYYKDGHYAPEVGARVKIKTEVDNIAHLALNTIHNFEWLKELIFIEFLKKQKANLADDELLKYWHIVNSQNRIDKMEEWEKKRVLNSFIKDYRSIPYASIPVRFREKAKCSVVK